MEIEQLIGYTAGACTTLAVLPQIVKSLRTKKMIDVSPVMFSILTFGVGVWTLYGIIKDDLPIIIFNGISFLLNFSMLLLMLLYRPKKVSN